MTKIGRNDPCPCGSGKKYKHCCLSRQPPSTEGTDTDRPSALGPSVAFEDDIDVLSNSVIDLLREGRIEEAESASKQLLERYPNQIDGLERMGMVEQAKGHHTLAAEYYRKSAHFARTHPGFDPEVAEDLIQRAESLEKQAGSD